MPKGGETTGLEAEIHRLKAAVQISTVVGASVTLKKEGREFTACCPFHNEKTPSFKVNDTRRFYHCFGCGAHGDVFDWLRERDGLTLPQAVERLGGAVVSADPALPAVGESWEPMVPPPDDAPRPNFAGWDRVYSYCDADGVPLFYVRRREAVGSQRKKFLPLTYGKLDGKIGWQARHPLAPRPLYGLDRLAAKPAAPVVVCEGEKAADAAQRLLPSYACVCWPAGTANAKAADWQPLDGRKVIIWPDNDAGGVKAATEIAGMLAGSVIISVDDQPAKGDAADLETEDGEEWLADRIARVDEARKKRNGHDETHKAPDPHTFDGLDTNEPLQPETRRRVRVFAGFRHIAADAGLAAMSAAGIPFYQRDRSLVRAGIAKAKAADGGIVEVPSLVPVTAPILARALGQSAEWERVNKDGEAIRMDPPKEVVEQIAAMFGDWPFPPISGVIGTPTMRPDGSLLLRPGYDEATGLVLLSPPTMPQIKSHPTKSDALDALALLYSLLDEFPFNDNIARSAAMSMILTPVLRGALAPAVPMHMVTAPQAGTGKSYLQDIASMLATGERCAVVTIAPDPQETEKRLVGAALAGFPIIALDNCNGTLTGDFLAQVTERPLLQLRPLGTSQVIRVSNVFTVFANGNNISVAADLVRRTLLCALDANLESPESRTFVQDPLAAIAADRGRYVAACLTLARAYVCAGFPNRLPRIPSFERWSDLVRSLLVWLNWEDPTAGTETIRAEDPTRNTRGALFEAWAASLELGRGYLAGEIIEAAEEYDHATNSFARADLRTALFEIAKAKNAERIDGKRLGWWLHSTAKVVAGRYKLMVDRTNPTRARWSIHAI
jgi:putative DNA primase/helicase